MELIIEKLRELIVNKQEILLEKLDFGACEASFDVFNLKIKLELPQSFYDFYSVFNGCVSSTTSIWSAMSMLPLSGILNEKTLMDKLQNEGNFNKWENGTWWNAGYLPFLSDFSNSLICIDTNGSFNGKENQIILWNNDDPSRIILFESFKNWLEALFILIETFDADIIAQKDAYMDFCISNINRISSTLNSEYPKFVKAERL